MNTIHLKKDFNTDFRGQQYGKPYFWFTLNATNEKILMTSVTYKSKQGAIKGIRSATKGTSIKSFTNHTSEKVGIVKF